ncbi:MAG: hypothetical protein K2X28_02890 [Alphaproteobacteria bacterium]|nr:hypothetical protein [Alphaproteobacteria bacterium]
MKKSHQYRLALLLSACFVSSPSSLYAGKGKELGHEQSNISGMTQNKKRKVAQPEKSKRNASKNGSLKRKKLDQEEDSVENGSSSSTASLLSHQKTKSELLIDKWKLAKSLFNEEEWQNIIIDVSEAVKNAYDPNTHQLVINSLDGKKASVDFIHGLRNLRGKVGVVSRQLIKDDKAKAAFALFCTYVHSQDVRESIASIFEANAYEILKITLRNYRVLDPLDYSDTEMGHSYGFKEGRESLAEILAKAFREQNDKFYRIFFEEGNDYFIKTLNYTFKRNHPLAIKVTESAFKPDLADLVAGYLSNYRFALLTGALKAGDADAYQALKLRTGDASSLVSNVEFKKHFLQTLLEASQHNDLFQKELESFQKTEPALIEKLKGQSNHKKANQVAEAHKLPAPQQKNEVPPVPPQGQPARVAAVNPLNAMHARIHLKPQEIDEVNGLITRVKCKQPELNDILGQHLMRYNQGGQGKSFKEYLQFLNTPHADGLLRQMELVRQAAEQLPALLQFAKQYQNHVYENPHDSEINYKTKAEEFKNLNKENPLLGAFELLEFEAAEAKWKLNPYNMKDASLEDLNTLEAIIQSFKDGNEQFMSSDLHGAILTVRAFLTHNTEICLELLASGNLFSRKHYAIKPFDIITHPEQDDANLETRAWNAYYTLIALWNKINEVKDPEERQYIKNKLARDYTKAPCIEAQSVSLDSWLRENEALLKGVMVEEEIRTCKIFEGTTDHTLSRILNALIGKLKLMDAKYQEEEKAFKQAQVLNESFRKTEETKKKKIEENPNNSIREIWGIFEEGKFIPTITNMPQDLIDDFFRLQRDRFKRIQEKYSDAENDLIDSRLKELSDKMSQLVGRKASDGLITNEHVHKVFESLAYSTEFLPSL